MPIKMDRNEIWAVYRQGGKAVVTLIEMRISRLHSLEAEVEKLKGNEVTEEAIKNAIRLSRFMQLDETGMYVKGKRIWENTYSTPQYTYYFCHPKRGKEAIDSGQMRKNFYVSL